MPTHKTLVDHMITNGALRTDVIIDAFLQVDRADFVPDGYSDEEIYKDRPLPIGYGQTISQPSTVAFMLELLQARRGNCVLDVGSGSGWTTALLAAIVGKKGHVYGVEIIPELVKIGCANIASYHFTHVSIRCVRDEYGLPSFAPYDRILVSAAGTEIPQALIDQLAPTGTMVIPVGGAVLRYIKKEGHEDKIERYEGFAFVPLIDPRHRRDL